MTVDIYAARQPIFDRELRVMGYELLYRPTAGNHFTDTDPEVASAQLIEHMLVGFGLKSLTQDRFAFLNITRHMLTREIYSMLPSERSVLEILETITPDTEVVAACARAKSQGYRIALDDFTYAPSYEPLLAIADFIKVDFRAHQGAARIALTKRLRATSARLIAEKVESYDDVQQARDLGYDLYQGYFFARPTMLHAHNRSPARLTYFKLIRAMNQVDVDLAEVERIIQEDVALSMKLLRYLHSASFAGQEVSSIRQALFTLGERPMRRWAALVAVMGLGKGKPSELVVAALTRARFAELMAPALGQRGKELELFLTGLLSMADALTDQPLADALEPLGLSGEVTASILVRSAPFGAALELATLWEQGDWDRADAILVRLGLSEETVQSAYADAVLWAEDTAQP
jgi:EAL and modified HD-GYP domain-containing signal transduction protein